MARAFRIFPLSSFQVSHLPLQVEDHHLLCVHERLLLLQPPAQVVVGQL
jgi:hypothetical protein